MPLCRKARGAQQAERVAWRSVAWCGKTTALQRDGGDSTVARRSCHLQKVVELITVLSPLVNHLHFGSCEEAVEREIPPFSKHASKTPVTSAIMTVAAVPLEQEPTELKLQ